MRDPGETLRALAPHHAALGITRVGLLTGLDRLAVPVAAAYRPNSRTLSVHQGKGLDDTTALVSAVMEAAEAAIAERPSTGAFPASPRAAAPDGVDRIDLARCTRVRFRDVPREGTLPHLWGFDLVSRRPLAVPEALVRLDHVGLDPADPFDRSSDGLAAGNNLAEAVLQGLHELVERDAAALFQAMTPVRTAARRRSPEAIGDAGVASVMTRLATAGYGVAFYDITSDLGVPCAAALVGRIDEDRRPDGLRAGLCAGYGCHRTVAGAAARALTEACQGHVTAVAGARDDIGDEWYRPPDGTDPTLRDLVAPPLPDGAPPLDLPAGSLRDRIADLVARLVARGIRQAVVVPLGGAEHGIAVVRMIVPGLETGLAGRARQPGARLLRTLLENAS